VRALILALSILAIVGSAHFAKAGLSSTPRETLTPTDTATDEATQKTEEQIGLTKAKRREVQRGLTRLGFDTKVKGQWEVRRIEPRRHRTLEGGARLPYDWHPQRRPA
jgi:hypothetical protein